MVKLMDDTIHHKQLRQNLVNLIHAKGIRNIGVLEAINRVPRHLFVLPETSLKQAYEDTALEIGFGQTISQPYTVAFQTDLLKPDRDHKVLEIGTGSGYQTAVLFESGASVYTIERQKKLYELAKQRLTETGYSQVHTYYGDGYDGLGGEAPFDRILVTAAADEIPSKLIEQLKTGGVMVIPVKDKILRVTKISEQELEVDDFEYFRFVPLLHGTVT